VPADWPGGVRRVGSVSLVCRACMERGKAGVDTALPPLSRGAGCERERAVRQEPEALSTVAAPAGGPACSSAEALVMGVERRGRLIDGLFARATGVPREETGGQVRSERQAV
jgi:hypothetical protein